MIKQSIQIVSMRIWVGIQVIVTSGMQISVAIFRRKPGAQTVH